MKTILDFYAPCFQLGKWTLIIPPALEIYPKASPKDTEEVNQGTLKRLWFALQAASVGYCAIHSVFIVVRSLFCLYQLAIGQANNSLEAISWLLVSFGPWITFFIFHKQNASFKKIYEDIHELSRRLTGRQMAQTGGEQFLRNRLQNERSYYIVTILLEISWVSAVPFFVAINGMYQRRPEGYIYAVVDDSVEIYWLKIASAAAQAYYCFSGYLWGLVVQTFDVYITRVTTLCVDLLSVQPDDDSFKRSKRSEVEYDGGNDAVSCPVIETFERNVAEYHHLRRTVVHFNEIHAWPLFFCKGIILVLSTILLYYPSTIKDTEYGHITSMLAYSCVIGILGRIFILMYSMGQFYRSTQRFTERWRRHLAWKGLLYEKNVAILHSCGSFGFESGDFYAIKPSTILTFLSVLLSYVIFAYQI